ncbi:virginiamycin B lyase family protein [Streptomyces sp. NBC_01298]|uniref:virginiamycin B lyase family protein n=1 Tax=Streptomyces sp. NBC_01298 TaxID=2903817 RepID=UPI003FA37833
MGAIPASAVVTMHSVPPGRAQGIAAGPGGNVWFTQPLGGQIRRVTPAGVATEDDVPAGNSTPVKIAAGADRNLWFTHFSANPRFGSRRSAPCARAGDGCSATTWPPPVSPCLR